MGMGEATLSPINSAAKALALANAVAADLCEPVVDQVAPFAHGFLFVELGDVYTFSANGKHYDSAQTLACYGYSHSFKGAFWKTSVSTRGKPGLGAETWHRHGSNAARQRPAHGKIVAGSAASATITLVQVIGGVRVHVAEEPRPNSYPTEREFHVSGSANFTPSSATLVALGPQREVVVPDRNPGETLYCKTVPRIRTFGPGGVPRISRGQPSTEQSAIAGYVEPKHFNPLTHSGPFPLNGGFEAPGVVDVAPEQWTLVVGSVPDDVTVNDSAQWTGTMSLVVLGTAKATEFYSAPIPCEPSTSKTLKLWLLRVGSAEASRSVTLALDWLDATRTLINSSTATVNVSGLSTTVWAEQTLTVTSHSGARWCRVTVKKSDANSDYSFRVDKVSVA